MNKFKIFLTGLTLILFSNFAFAIEKKPEIKIKQKKLINEKYIIFINSDDVFNFEFENEEKKDIEKIIINILKIKDIEEFYNFKSYLKLNILKFAIKKFLEETFLEEKIDFSKKISEKIIKIPLKNDNNNFEEIYLTITTIIAKKYKNSLNAVYCLIKIENPFFENLKPIYLIPRLIIKK